MTEAKVIHSKKPNLLLEMATGSGKTRLALLKTIQWFKQDSKILIVIPKNVLIDGWIAEIHKWKCDKLLANITFSTYVSVPDQDVNWDIVIYDEAHHLSERCREAIAKWNVKHSIWLSATLPYVFRALYVPMATTEYIKVSTQKAISNGILPELSVILVPLKLSTEPTELIIKNPKGKLPAIHTSWATRWNAWKQKVYKVETVCSPRQYYDDFSSKIEWYKRMPKMKNTWLQKSGERLRWLAAQKEEVTKAILNTLQDQRVLTFCSTIAQSEEIGNSVNCKRGTENLHAFNEGAINHLSAVGMLDEGCNLTSCQVGIFNMINSSERLVTQRIGRILRHPDPIVIIPYFVNTREQEIVTKMVEGYNTVKCSLEELKNLFNNV